MVLVRRPAYDGSMWLAICSNNDCRWDRIASSKANAEFDGHAHQFDYEGNWSDRVHAVFIPAESQSAQNTSRNAAQTFDVPL
jgi:hypothetical protein